MFEIESKNEKTILVSTKKASILVDVEKGEIEGKLAVGKISGPGEFEIGDIGVRGIGISEGRTIYDIEVEGVHVGVIGEAEEGLDDLGVADILCTSSVRAVREIEPKLVVAMGNIDGMVTELKLVAKAEKRLKVKNADSLPTTLEVVALN